MANNEASFVQSLMDQLNGLASATTTVELPTKGKLDKIDSKVTLRMMTTHEEKIRTGASSKISWWKLISQIINKCVVEPKGLDVYKLTVVDFIFLMYKLRIASYGKNYKVNLSTCPECDKKLQDVVVDLTKLPVKYIDEMDKELVEPFDIKLPKTGWTVQCRLLRMNELDLITEEADRIQDQFPNYEGDPMIPLRLSRQIVSINGQPIDRTILQQIIDKLPAVDENAITRTFDELDVGMKLIGEYVCPHCGKTLKIPLSYTEEFFRPSSD